MSLRMYYHGSKPRAREGSGLNLEIRARLYDLLRRLATLGPIERIKQPDVKTGAQLMYGYLQSVERSMEAVKQNEKGQLFALNLAQKEWESIVALRDVWPPVMAKQKRATSAKGKAAERRHERNLDARDDEVRRTAADEKMKRSYGHLQRTGKLFGLSADAVKKIIRAKKTR